MYQKWQAALFDKLITDLLSQIHSTELNWFQFNLVLKEGCIKFRTLTEQLKFRKHFQENQFVNKQMLRDMLVLSSTIISNNKRFLQVLDYCSVIRMKESQEDLLHKPFKCFEWWKHWMTKKYGPDLKWFDVVCMQKDCFRLKTFKFKTNMEILLKDTPHSKCFLNIMSFFPKTQKNEIQFSSFMSTIKVSVKPTYVDTSMTKKQLNKLSHSKALSSKQKVPMTQKSLEKIKRLQSQTSQTFYVTEWGSEQQDKVERRSGNHVRGRILRKKSVSKTTTNFYSMPVKESAEKIKRNQRYKSVYI